MRPPLSKPQKFFISVFVVAVLLGIWAWRTQFIYIGLSVEEYIREHGEPTALSETCVPIKSRLQGLRLTGVRVLSEIPETLDFRNRLLIYPETDSAAKSFLFLPNVKPINDIRSIHHSKRTIFGNEIMRVVSVDENGSIKSIERFSYDWFTLYE